MLSGLAIVFLLIVISGLIAYIGDYVGRKVGKRRVSIFKLRPKYTSIIITIITGILIVSVTLAILFSFSEYARTSFFGLQKIRRDLKEKRHELSEVRGLETKLRKAYKKSVGELRRKQDELDGILGEINQKSLELSELKESQDKLNEELKRINNETKKLKERKTKLEEEIRERAGRLSEVSVETLYGDILYKKDQTLARVTVAKDISESDLRTRLILMINTILAEAVKKGALVDEDTSIIFNEQFKSLKPLLGKTENDLIIEALAANNVFKGQQMYIKLRLIEMRRVFAKGEIIDTIQIGPRLTRGEVEETLRGMLSRTSLLARNHGMLPDPETQRVGTISSERFIQTVDKLTDLKMSKTVNVVALKDTMVNEKLQIDFVVK